MTPTARRHLLCNAEFAAYPLYGRHAVGQTQKPTELVSNEATNASDTTDDKKKNGCGSSVNALGVITVAVMALGVGVIKKKR